MNVSSVETSSIEVATWLAPLADESGPCGKDLEYENDYLELIKAAEGTPETQFGPGEPPNWREVRAKAAQLLTRSRDLRIAILWVRSVVNLNGFSMFPEGMRLIDGLINQFWEQLHPLPDPDDGDLYARLNAVSVIPLMEGLLGDLRQCVFFSVKGVGEIRYRAVELALGLTAAKPEESSLTKDQLMQIIAGAASANPDLDALPKAAASVVVALTKTLNEKFGVSAAPNLKPIADVVKTVQSLLPSAGQDSNSTPEFEGTHEPSVKGDRSNGPVRSREDAVSAIDMVCDYLERTEPSNPAQFLLRRARKMINHDFLQLVKELAPDALSEVARIMGVNPDDVEIKD
jgi:type VI secretion system protein ImpA